MYPRTTPPSVSLRVTTLRDVARAASVSMSTASRVLAGSEKPVTDDLRARVHAAAEALGYTPNHSAQAMARGTAPVITLMVTDLDDPYFGRLATGVMRGVDETGLVLNVAVTGHSRTREQQLIHAIRTQRPRGLIIGGSRDAEVPDPSVDEWAELEALGTCVVAIGESEQWPRSVPVSNLDGARALGVAVARRGNNAAIVLAAPEGVRSSDERSAGFVEGFAAAGGVLHAVHRAELSRAGGAAAMEAALASPLPHDPVVFAVADVMALGAATVLRANHLRVGGDVALCGFSEIPSSSDVTPALTTVHLPLEQIGYAAVLRCLGREPSAIDQRPSFEVLIRDSTPYLL